MNTPDELPITPVFSPAAIKKVREINKASPSIFAGRLNVSTSTIWRWEAGTVKPNGFARKLLAVVQKHGLQILT
jgi:putative transcriptional regulator